MFPAYGSSTTEESSVLFVSNSLASIAPVGNVSVITRADWFFTPHSVCSSISTLSSRRWIEDCSKKKGRLLSRLSPKQYGDYLTFRGSGRTGDQENGWEPFRRAGSKGGCLYWSLMIWGTWKKIYWTSCIKSEDTTPYPQARTTRQSFLATKRWIFSINFAEKVDFNCLMIQRFLHKWPKFYAFGQPWISQQLVFLKKKRTPLNEVNDMFTILSILLYSEGDSGISIFQPACKQGVDPSNPNGKQADKNHRQPLELCGNSWVRHRFVNVESFSTSMSIKIQLTCCNKSKPARAMERDRCQVHESSSSVQCRLF